MDTIDDIREALGGPGPRNGDHRPGDNGRGNGRPDSSGSIDFEFSESCTNISRGRVPGRGLLYSFLFHEIAIFLLLYAPGQISFRVNKPRPADEPLFIDSDLLKADLPPVGGGKAGAEGKKKGSPGKKGDAAPGSQGHKGFAYPGPQPIESKPPVPDNPVQTIRQPDVVNPPPVKVELKLPNQIKIAAPKIPDAPTLKGAMHPVEVAVHVPAPPPPPPEVKPKLVLPKAELAALPAALRQDLAAAAPRLKAPKPPPPGVLPSTGDQLRNLAVLSPIAKHTTEIAEIPRGEARGAFAIAPELVKGPTSEPGGGTGNSPGAGSAKAPTGSTESGAGAGGTANGKGTSPGASLEAGNGLGTGSASGNGEGSTGTGLGSGGSGTGKGSGAGAGLGPGSGPFAGLSVNGGTGSGGSIPRGQGMRMIFGPDKPYGYGMNVEAQGPSGGLRDYGTFRDNISYTVYLDMSQANQPPVSWTLQYAVLNPAASGTVVTLKKAKAVTEGAEQQILPPIPVTTVDPKLPPEIAKQYPGHLLVVYAEISAEGRLEKIHIVDSPDIELTRLVLQALVKWSFKPALENGKPVAVKTLFGVPLAPPEKAVDHKPAPPVDHKPVPPMVHRVPPPLITMKHAPEVHSLTLNGSGPERAVTLNPKAGERAVTLDSKASARAVTLGAGSSGRSITLKPVAPGANRSAPTSSATPKKSGQKPEERAITLK